MCTAMFVKSAAGDFLFGRNLDFGFPTKPELICIPAGTNWENMASGSPRQSLFALVGIGQTDTGRPVFLDGTNSQGFAAAALYFPGYAKFAEPQDSAEPGAAREQLDALDVVRATLESCANCAELEAFLGSVSIVGIPNNITHEVAPLHWIFADTSGDCRVLECTSTGVQLHKNPFGVLTNSPDFVWQTTNLRNYGKFGADQPEAASLTTLGGQALAPFGQGAGLTGLPGGYTPPERFVRAAFMRELVQVPADPTSAAVALTRALDTCAVPLGAATDAHGADFTQYQMVINLSKHSYHTRTYFSPALVETQLTPLFSQSLPQTSPADKNWITVGALA